MIKNTARKSHYIRSALALLLALTMIISLSPTSVFADSDGSAEEIKTELLNVASNEGNEVIVSNLSELKAALLDTTTTVRLNADITVDGKLTISKSITIDLDGHAIKYSSEDSYCFSILNLTDGTGEVTIKNGTIKNHCYQPTNTVYGVTISGSMVLNVIDVSVDVENESYDTLGAAAIGIYVDNGTLNFSSGSVKVSFGSTVDCIKKSDSSSNCIKVMGGTFTSQISQGYLADGYICTGSGTSWTVSKAAAKIGSSYYATLSAAVGSLSADNQTIELLDNIRIDADTTYSSSYSYTIDQKGKVFIGDGKTLTFTTASGTPTVTLTDTSYSGESTPSWSGDVFVSPTFTTTNGITLNITGGFFGGKYPTLLTGYSFAKANDANTVRCVVTGTASPAATNETTGVSYADAAALVAAFGTEDGTTTLQDKNVINLLEDISLSDTLYINKAITLNFNGHTLTSSAKECVAVQADITSGAAVVLKNGTIASTYNSPVGSDEQPVVLHDLAANSTVELQGMTITAAGADPSSDSTGSFSTFTGINSTGRLELKSITIDDTVIKSTVTINSAGTDVAGIQTSGTAALYNGTMVSVTTTGTNKTAYGVAKSGESGFLKVTGSTITATTSGGTAYGVSNLYTRTEIEDSTIQATGAAGACFVTGAAETDASDANSYSYVHDSRLYFLRDSATACSGVCIDAVKDGTAQVRVDGNVNDGYVSRYTFTDAGARNAEPSIYSTGKTAAYNRSDYYTDDGNCFYSESTAEGAGAIFSANNHVIHQNGTAAGEAKVSTTSGSGVYTVKLFSGFYNQDVSAYCADGYICVKLSESSGQSVKSQDVNSTDTDAALRSSLNAEGYTVLGDPNPVKKSDTDLDGCSFTYQVVPDFSCRIVDTASASVTDQGGSYSLKIGDGVSSGTAGQIGYWSTASAVKAAANGGTDDSGIATTISSARKLQLLKDVNLSAAAKETDYGLAEPAAYGSQIADLVLTTTTDTSSSYSYLGLNLDIAGFALTCNSVSNDDTAVSLMDSARAYGNKLAYQGGVGVVKVTSPFAAANAGTGFDVQASNIQLPMYDTRTDSSRDNTITNKTDCGYRLYTYRAAKAKLPAKKTVTDSETGKTTTELYFRYCFLMPNTDAYSVLGQGGHRVQFTANVTYSGRTLAADAENTSSDDNSATYNRIFMLNQALKNYSTANTCTSFDVTTGKFSDSDTKLHDVLQSYGAVCKNHPYNILSCFVYIRAYGLQFDSTNDSFSMKVTAGSSSSGKTIKFADIPAYSYKAENGNVTESNTGTY